jgi:predicted ATP-binding protein involved in virulence
MNILSMKIDKLFGVFDYDISFQENLLIITGPNGFGKTMILNIVYSLFNRHFSLFQNLDFEKISIELVDSTFIEITKVNKEHDTEIVLQFLYKGAVVDRLIYVGNAEIGMSIEDFPPIQIASDNVYLDQSRGKVIILEEAQREYSSLSPSQAHHNQVGVSISRSQQILDTLQVHLVREHRLYRPTANDALTLQMVPHHNLLVENIQTFAQELKQLINEYLQQYFLRTQELDSSYPFRLRDEINVLSEAEYQNKYSLLEQKQLKLKAFGLFDSKQEFPSYSIEDAKALSVYLKDYELKLGVFDDLIQKLELFSSILNERRFTYKSVVINRENGFLFKTSNGKDLTLTQLSSGEQHEVVLLYELIFKVQPNVLVLIDEPEVSLHITWQKEFLKDLLKIISLKNIQVVIATHAPAIINDRWDLVYNLQPSA